MWGKMDVKKWIVKVQAKEHMRVVLFLGAEME